MNIFSRQFTIFSNIGFCAVLALATFTACSKKESGTKGSPNLGAVPQGSIKSAEKTSFAEVTSHLDAGGNMYGYLSTTEWFDGLSGRMNEWREAALSLPNLGEKDSTNINTAFEIGTRLVKASGLEQVSGVGFSGIALEPGYYQTKIFAHRSAASDGLLWSATGKAAHPLTQLEWLPADTAWAMFSDLDFAASWAVTKEELANADFPGISAGLKTMEEDVKKSTGTDLSELLGSLGGEYGIVLTLNQAHKVSVPIVNSLEVPEPGLIITVKVKDDACFDLFAKKLKGQKDVISVEKNGYRARVIPMPLPLPITLRLTVARFGDYLFLASNDALIDQIVDVKNGKKPGLKSSPEFQRLAKGMPTEGNQFVFLSENMGKTLREVQTAYMDSPLGKMANQQASAALVRKLFQSGPISATYSVGGHTKDGWLNVTHGNKNPVTLMAGPLIVAPTAILASMAIPAFAKAKERAGSVTCANNLKQIGIAIKAYAADHQNTFPPDLASLKESLGSPKVLICPSDKKVPDASQLTWENFEESMSNYEFLMPNAKDGKGIANKVLARCPIHGHTCLADGSVVQAKTNLKP